MDIRYFLWILLICITGEQHYGSWIDPSQEAVDPPGMMSNWVKYASSVSLGRLRHPLTTA